MRINRYELGVDNGGFLGLAIDWICLFVGLCLSWMLGIDVGVGLC